jgi:protocatechuate 3,4-dioxygenase, beta subunit
VILKLKTMKQLVVPFMLLLLANISCGQANNRPNSTGKLVGDGCEGCEAIYECPVPFDKLSWIDTLPDFNEAGPKMVISGTIYRSDGKTPAKDVVLYIYHTDQQGNYSQKGNEKGWGKRHGYIRGWMKTNEKGQYKFYTLRPASYPNSDAPQHIHPTVKETDKSEYWIDEFVFDDDPNLKGADRNRPQPRGGNGVIKLRQENGLLVGERDIVLGKNVPGY